MKETSTHHDEPLIAHDEAAKMPEPGEGAFHDLPPPAAPQLAAILMRRPFMVGASGDARLDPPTCQACPPRGAVIAAISHQPFRALAGSPGLPWPPDGDGVEILLEVHDLRWGSRLQVCSQRIPAPSTKTSHFVPLPRFVLPTLVPLFWRE